MLDWYAQPRYRPFSLTHEGDAAERPVVLMIHGFTGTPDELRPTAQLAHDAGFDVEVMSLPGMAADIGRLREHGREDWLQAVHERWAEVTGRYRRRVLLGYSLGASLAILASVSRPADAMVMMAPLIRLADSRAFLLPVARHMMSDVAPFESMDFTKRSVREFFERTMPGLDIDDRQVQKAIRREFVMPTRLLNDCRLVGRDAGRVASAIREPVTIFQGRPDAVVGHRNARWLVDHLGGPVTYHEIAGDHLIPFDTTPSWSEMRPLVAYTFARIYARLNP